MSPPALSGLHLISRGQTGKCSKENGSTGQSLEVVLQERKLKEMDDFTKRAQPWEQELKGLICYM